MKPPIPLNQISFAVLDLRRTEAWWREGLGFLPAGGNRLLFRGPLVGMIQKIRGLAMTCWCLVGRSAWAQIEMFQYESPQSVLMPHHYRPCDLGYSRCGVWVADFDGALVRLEAHGSAALAPPIGVFGQRRACVRNPDGVYVEIMEADPLPDENGKGRMDCPVAIRYATLSTPDLEKTTAFLIQGLGMRVSNIVLHDDAHEAIWQLEGAHCTRRVFIGGSGSESILLEAVQYHNPMGQPLPADYRLCDQRILNVCFGDPSGPTGLQIMRRRALAAGATPNCPHIHMGLAGCVYVEDPLGFSFEFMWARWTLGHRIFGFVPSPAHWRPQADNQQLVLSVEIDAPVESVFNLVSDHAQIGSWSSFGASQLLHEGETTTNGRGAVRNIRGPFGEIWEEITDFVPDRSYRYRVIKGLPVSCYSAEIAVEPCLVDGRAGTRVHRQVRFRSRIPGLGTVLRHTLRNKISSALLGLKKALESPVSTHEN
ncbi:MAG: SRPBCC family protein [Herbaspirillum sp.]